MRCVTGGAVAVAVALGACGGDDGGGEVTPDHIVAAVREVDPQCSKPRVRPNGPDVGEVICGKASAVLYSRHSSSEAAESFAGGSGGITYTSGRLVIHYVPGDHERFIDELRVRCDCKIKRH